MIVLLCAQIFVDIFENEKLIDIANYISDPFETLWKHIEIPFDEIG